MNIKKIKIILFLFIGLVYASSNSLAQNTKRKEIDKVDILLYKGETEKANKTINKFLAKDPENSALNYYKAIALIRLEQEDRVVDYLRKAVKNDSSNFYALYKLGAYYYNDFIDQYKAGDQDSLMIWNAKQSQILFEKYVSTINSKKLFAKLDNIYKVTQLDTTQLYELKKPFNYKLQKKYEEENILEKPKFPRGEQAMYQFIGDNLVYPQTAKIRGVSGRVFASFIVEVDGSVSNIKIHRGLKGGCNEEVVRVISKMPKWSPGINKEGEKVRVQYRMPIKFTLN